MKRIFYFAFCIFTCLAFMTACEDSYSTTDNTKVSSDASDGGNAIVDDSDEAIDNNHDDNDQVEEVPVGEVTPSEGDKNDSTENTEEDSADSTESNLTDAQENVAEDPEKEFQASGTFNGFIDNSSIEVTMSDGTYQTFFVLDETVKNHLAQLEGNETPPTIQFVYKAKEGQRNPEIISVK